jgi:hypothetical protein
MTAGTSGVQNPAPGGSGGGRHLERYNWKSLNRLQLGRFAEYFVKMEFTLYGADIYSPEIDDKGIDFIVRTGVNKYWEVQVKSLYRSSNQYLDKRKFDIAQPNLLVALVRFAQGEAPKVYLLRSKLWKLPMGYLSVMTEKAIRNGAFKSQERMNRSFPRLLLIP